jgi:hypothetical protein
MNQILRKIEHNSVALVFISLFINWTLAANAQFLTNDTHTNYWTGYVSTEWTNAANWSKNVIPVFNDSVIIPAGCPRYPVLNTVVMGEAGYFELQKNASFTINGGLLSISGDMVIRGELISNRGTVRLNGSDMQQIFGMDYLRFHTLVITNTSTNGVVFHYRMHPSDQIFALEGATCHMTTDMQHEPIPNKMTIVELISE